MRISPSLAGVGCVIIALSGCVALSGCGTQAAGQRTHSTGNTSNNCRSSTISPSITTSPQSITSASPQGITCPSGTNRPAGITSRPPADPHQRAVADAARIIASFPVPAGAARSSRAPSQLLNAPAEGPPATPDVATATRWWTAPGQPQAVLAWVAAHVPAGFKPAGQGFQGYRPVRAPLPAKQPPPRTALRPYEWFEVFALPPVPTVLTQRWLLVEVVRDAGGRTAIRADSQVVWLPAKPPAERIPPDATEVTVTVRPNLGPVSASQRRDDLPVMITDPAKVAKIAALVDGLPVFPPRSFSCPADFGGGIRLTFRAHHNGPAVALVSVDPSGCQVVSVVINGRDQPALSDGGSLQRNVLAIADVRWPLPPG